MEATEAVCARRAESSRVSRFTWEHRRSQHSPLLLVGLPSVHQEDVSQYSPAPFPFRDVVRPLSEV